MGLNGEVYKLDLRDSREEGMAVQPPGWCIEY